MEYVRRTNNEEEQQSPKASTEELREEKESIARPVQEKSSKLKIFLVAFFAVGLVALITIGTMFLVKSFDTEPVSAAAFDNLPEGILLPDQVNVDCTRQIFLGDWDLYHGFSPEERRSFALGVMEASKNNPLEELFPRTIEMPGTCTSSGKKEVRVYNTWEDFPTESDCEGTTCWVAYVQLRFISEDEATGANQ